MIARGAAVAVALAGCQPAVAPLVVSGAEGDLLIAAVISRDGDRVLSAERVDPARGTASVPVAEGQRLIAFRLSREDLLDERGRRLEAPLQIATRERAAAGAGACGRCMVPSDRAPAIFFPGDLCPIPGFAEVTAEEPIPPELDALVRREVSLAVPGACACGFDPVEPARDIQIDSLLPDGLPRIYEQVAIDDRGFVAAASLEAARLYDASGADLGEVSLRRSDLWNVFTLGPMPPDPGREAGFMLGRRGPTHDEAEYRSLSVVAGAPRERTAREAWGLLPSVFVPLGDALIVAGSVKSIGTQAPAAARCTVRGTGFECALEEPCASCLVRDISSAAVLDDGSLVIGGEGQDLLWRSPTGVWQTGHLAGEAIHPPVVVKGLAVAGARLWVCLSARFEGDRFRNYVLTANISSDRTATLETSIALELAPTMGPSGACDRGLFTSAGGGDAMMLLLEGEGGPSLISLDAQGRMGARERLEAKLEGRTPAKMARSGNGWIALMTGDGAIYRRGPTETTFRRLHGSPLLRSRRPTTVARTGPGRFAAVMSDGETYRLSWAATPRSSADVSFTPTPLRVRSDGDTDALGYSAGDDRLYRVALRGRTLTMSRLDLEAGRAEALGEATLSATVGLTHLQLAEAQPGTMVVLAAGGTPSLWAWSGARGAFEVIEGDPVTTLQALDAQAGLVWATGGDIAARIRAGAGGALMVERFDLLAMPRADFPEPVLFLGMSAPRMVCPDVVLLGGQGLHRELAGTKGRSWLGRLCLNARCGSEPGSESDRTPRLALEARRWRREFSRPVALVGRLDEPVVIGVGSDVFGSDGSFTRVPFPGAYRVVADGDAFLIGGSAGWLAVGYPLF
ncbi:MAG: hypothetical protein IT384_24360 [Deltaproteobacteria bacterium]|nr:hypothetical protein [Deltaproteobacteria bacterium]